MNCPKCNNEIVDDSIYCPKCGVRLDQKMLNTPSKFRHANKILGRVGYGMSIAGLSLCWAFAFGLLCSIIGLFSSVFGTDSDEAALANKTRKLSIIGVILGGIFALAETVLLVLVVAYVVRQYLGNQ